MQTIDAFNIAKGEFMNTIKSLSVKDKETPISFGAWVREYYRPTLKTTRLSFLMVRELDL